MHTHTTSKLHNNKTSKTQKEIKKEIKADQRGVTIGKNELERTNS